MEQAQIYIFFSGHHWVVGEGADIWSPFSLDWRARDHAKNEQKVDGAVLVHGLRSTHGAGSLESSELYLILLKTWLRSQSSRVQWATNSVSDIVYKWLFCLAPSCQELWSTFCRSLPSEERNFPLFCIFCHKWEEIGQDLNCFSSPVE